MDPPHFRQWEVGANLGDCSLWAAAVLSGGPGRPAAVKFDGRVVDQAKALKASCEAAEAALESAIVDGHGGKLEEAIQAARGVHENFHSP